MMKKKQLFCCIILWLLLANFSAIAQAPKSRTIRIEGQSYFIHRVLKGQSLYSLAKFYELPVDSLVAANQPGFKSLETGTDIKIPIDDRYLYHTAQKRETLHDIARRYNSPSDTVFELNKDLRDQRKLKEWQVVKLPNPDYRPVVKPDPTAKKDSVKVPGDVESVVGYTEEPCEHFKYHPDTVFQVALMLPVCLNRNTHIPYVMEPQQAEQVRFYSNTRRFLEFYAGALIALDSLRQQGLSIELSLFDTQRDSARVAQIVASDSLKNMDLIIGPVYPKPLAIVANYAKEQGINIVSPLARVNHLLTDNSRLFQVNATITARAHTVASYLSQFDDKNIILLHDGTEDEQDIIEVYRHYLDSIYLSDSTKALKILHYKDGGGVIGVRNLLSESYHNVILVPSINELFVTTVISRLNILKRYRNMLMLGDYKWEEFGHIEFEYYDNLRIHYYGEDFIDYSREEVHNFVYRYRNVFYSEPSRYSFQGFDVCYYFLSTLKKYGPEFQYCFQKQDLEQINCKGLQCRFNFLRVDKTGGFENAGVTLIKCDRDYNLRCLKVPQESIFDKLY